MNDAVLESELDRIVFKVYALPTFLFDELKIRKIRAAVLIEPDPDFSSVDVGGVDLDVAAQLLGVEIVDRESEVCIANEEKFLSRNSIIERRVL